MDLCVEMELDARKPAFENNYFIDFVIMVIMDAILPTLRETNVSTPGVNMYDDNSLHNSCTEKSTNYSQRFRRKQCVHLYTSITLRHMQLYTLHEFPVITLIHPQQICQKGSASCQYLTKEKIKRQ